MARMRCFDLAARKSVFALSFQGGKLGFGQDQTAGSGYLAFQGGKALFEARQVMAQ